MTQTSGSFWKSIHQTLLPSDTRTNYLPYIWLIYLVFYLFGLFSQPLASWEISLGLLGMLVFLVLYFRTYWSTRKTLSFYIAATTLLGCALSDLTTGANVYFIYAASFCSRYNNPKKVLIAFEEENSKNQNKN